MYAVIATGGKQYKVEEGDVIKVEKLGLEDGSKVTFEDVIAVCKYLTSYSATKILIFFFFIYNNHSINLLFF